MDGILFIWFCLTVLFQQINCIKDEGKRLGEKYPHAENHISSKILGLKGTFANLVLKSKDRREKLHHAEKVQEFTDEYNELM